MKYTIIGFCSAVAVSLLCIGGLNAERIRQITAQDYLKAGNIGELIKLNPELADRPPVLHGGQQAIIRAILAEDIENLIRRFGKVISISLNDVYYEEVKITPFELNKFRDKQSIIHKFIFNHAATLSSLPKYVRAHGSHWGSIQEYIQGGEYLYSTSAFIAFQMSKPVETSMSILTECNANDCIITGFQANGG